MCKLGGNAEIQVFVLNRAKTPFVYLKVLCLLHRGILRTDTMAF